LLEPYKQHCLSPRLAWIGRLETDPYKSTEQTMLLLRKSSNADMVQMLTLGGLFSQSIWSITNSCTNSVLHSLSGNPPLDVLKQDLQTDCELILPCAQFTLFKTELCLAGLQACSQGVPWWNSRMTGRPFRPVLALVLAFFARSWTTTAKACRLASQPCQPPEVDGSACHACPWSPIASVICF
jgi:hypothetical protein